MNEIIRVHSHPRSGTNYLCKLMKINFYPDLDTTVRGAVGHWSDRKPVVTDYGKVFGSHSPNPIKDKCLYIYRDGRAVAYSCWRSTGIIHRNMKKLSFLEFLTTPLDWYGSPSNRVPKGPTIVESWYRHVSTWKGSTSLGVHFVRYEDLLKHPVEILGGIAARFGLDEPSEYQTTVDLVGPSPNEGKADSWTEVFGADELTSFHETVPIDCDFLSSRM
jgi:hypothetical protein